MIRIFFSLMGFVVLTFCLSGPASTQETSAQETSAQVDLQPLPAQVVARFDQMLAEIEVQKEDIKSLDARSAVYEGLIAELLGTRRDRLWTSMFQNTATLARDVAAQEAGGKDISAYEDQLIAELTSLPDGAYGAMQRLRSRVEFPSPDLPPDKFVVADQKLFKHMVELDAIYRALNAYIEIADEFGLDATEEREYMVSLLSDSAANRSIFLELALDDVIMLKSTVATLPGNTDLADWLSAVETRVKLAAKSVQDIVALMNALGLETRQYRQQVLKVTGEITTDVLDVGIVASLLSEWSKAIIDLVSKEGFRILFRLLLVAFILFAFVQLANLVQKLVNRGLDSARIHISHLLRRMIVSTARNLIIILGVLIAISQLGISLGPLLAGLGIAGFIIGFALQDTLSNFASGLMILMYRPFDVGDVVEAGGVSGKVSHMSLVNTTFMTFDNQKLVVPNNMIWSSVITNLTAQRKRRVDLTVGISYEDDIEKAETVLREIISEHEAVLDDPEPNVRLHELGESSLNFIVRPWVKTSDYWDTYWELTKAIKLRFDKEGISIPYPQRDVHVIEQKA
jgi:small conductance mechanosensitive channel